MPAGNIKTFTFEGFTGGLNRDADPYQLELTESPDALNVDFGIRGAVSKRDGYARYDSPTVADKFRSLYSWERMGGSVFLIAITDAGDIYEDAGAALADTGKHVGGSDDTEDKYPTAYASLNNKLYITGMDVARTGTSWDGTTAVSITATVFDGTASRYPNAKYTVAKHDRIFAANIDDNGTRLRSRVYFSVVLTPTTWNAADFIDFTPDDGQEITAMVAFGEDIVVFKDHSLQLLTGASEDSFSRFVIDGGIGTNAPGSVVAMGNRLIFLDRDRGVWAWDGGAFENIGDKINDYLLDGINYSKAYKTHAFVRRSKLYLSVPWGSDAFNSRMFVWDQRTQAWSEYDYGVSSSAPEGSAVRGGMPGNADGVFTLFTTKNDAGAAIDAYVRTPWLSPEGPEAKSRIRRMDMAFTALGAFDVDVQMFRDFDDINAYRSQVINTDDGASVWGGLTWGSGTWGGGLAQVLALTTGWGQRFRAVQFRFGVDGTGEDFQLNKTAIHVSSQKRVRGEA